MFLPGELPNNFNNNLSGLGFYNPSAFNNPPADPPYIGAGPPPGPTCVTCAAPWTRSKDCKSCICEKPNMLSQGGTKCVKPRSSTPRTGIALKPDPRFGTVLVPGSGTNASCPTCPTCPACPAPGGIPCPSCEACPTCQPYEAPPPAEPVVINKWFLALLGGFTVAVTAFGIAGIASRSGA